jgi:hypothetical protein
MQSIAFFNKQPSLVGPIYLRTLCRLPHDKLWFDAHDLWFDM